jgi:hypothetical protein
VSVRVRWWREALGPLDTRRTAVLYLVDDGTQTMDVSVACRRAGLILARHCLFSLPESGELCAALAEWWPRPYLCHAIDSTHYQPEVCIGGGRVRGRSIFEYREYVVPGDFVLVSAAVRFTRLATDCLSARAVTSAAWAVLSVAEREPNDLEGTDQLLHQRARSSRCVTLVSLAVKDRGAGHG